MSNIPFENQRLPVNLVEQIAYDIAQGKGASGDVLLGALEQSGGHQLDDRLRDIIRRFSVAAVKRPGRPTICKGREVAHRQAKILSRKAQTVGTQNRNGNHLGPRYTSPFSP